MAGYISVHGTGWSVAGDLFRWVLDEVATGTSDEDTAAALREIVQYNIGMLFVDELPEPGRAQVVRELQHIEDRARSSINGIPGRRAGVELVAQLQAAARRPSVGASGSGSFE